MKKKSTAIVSLVSKESSTDAADEETEFTSFSFYGPTPNSTAKRVLKVLNTDRAHNFVIEVPIDQYDEVLINVKDALPQNRHIEYFLRNDRRPWIVKGGFSLFSAGELSKKVCDAETKKNIFDFRESPYHIFFKHETMTVSSILTKAGKKWGYEWHAHHMDQEEVEKEITPSYGLFSLYQNLWVTLSSSVISWALSYDKKLPFYSALALWPLSNLFPTTKRLELHRSVELVGGIAGGFMSHQVSRAVVKALRKESGSIFAGSRNKYVLATVGLSTFLGSWFGVEASGFMLRFFVDDDRRFTKIVAKEIRVAEMAFRLSAEELKQFLKMYANWRKSGFEFRSKFLVDDNDLDDVRRKVRERVRKMMREIVEKRDIFDPFAES